MQQMADELQDMVTVAGLPPPYLLVGHSWGGAVTRLFAAEHPQQVAGLVWIEALHPDGFTALGGPESTLGGLPAGQIAAMPAVARLGLFRLLPGMLGGYGQVPGLPDRQQAELTAFFNSSKWADYVVAVEQALPDSLNELRRSPSLGAIPLLVVVGLDSDNGSGAGLELQKELAALSTNGMMVTIPGADHSSLVHQPEYARQVSDAIRAFLAINQ
jgi:pimeloyl-ACP methyl ester carboxylesterase